MNGEGSISQTVARTGLAQSRVSSSVAAFTKRGWMTTRPDPDDGRRTLVRVTDRVRRLGDQRRAGGAGTALTEALADLPARERQTLLRSLERLHELLVH